MARQLLAALLIAAPAVAHAQSFVVDGVIHDAATLAPLSGVAVFILDDASGDILSPGELDDPRAQGQVTAADGRYALSVKTPHTFRLSLERPNERFAFPSTTKPPEGATDTQRFGGIACSSVTCPGGQLSPNPGPVERAPYALRFDSRSGPSAHNNHIPVDALDKVIQLKLLSDRARVRIGEYIGLTIETTATLAAPVLGATAVLVLPKELRYAPNSARSIQVGPDNRTIETQLMPQQKDLQLRFGPTVFLPGATQQRVRLLARVVAQEHDEKLELRSYVEGGGGVLISNESLVRVAIAEDPVLEESTIFGSVFCEDDGGRKGWRDAAEDGLFGARVYLDTGFSAASDIDGLFHFSNVPEGMHLLKLDERTLPPGSEALGPTRVQLDLTPGVPAKVRFPVHCEFEVIEDPNKVTRGAKQAELNAAANEAQELALALDFDAHTFTLGARADELLTAKLEGRPAPEDPLRLRFIPKVEGTRSPTRWLIRVDEVDQQGRAIRGIKEPLTGRGLPPPFVDLLIDRSGAYRAQLEVEAGDYDTARSASIDVVTSTATKSQEEAKTMIARVATEAEAKPLAAKLATMTLDRVIIEGHWDDTPDASDQSRAFAERVKAVLEKAGADAVPMEIVARGAEQPLVPAISPRAKKQNRRVELYAVTKKEVPAKKRRPPRRPDIIPPSLSLTVDGTEAALALPAGPKAEYSFDLDVPAQVELNYDDGTGAHTTARRVVTARRVARPGERTPVVPRVDHEQGRLYLGPVELPLPVFAAQITAVKTAGDSVTVELSRAAELEAWRVTLEEKSGRVLAEAAGTGALPGTVVLTSSIAREEPTLVRFVASIDSSVRVEQRPVEVPPLRQAFDKRIPRVELKDRVRLGDEDVPKEGADLSGRILTIGDQDRLRVPLVEIEALEHANDSGSEDSADTRSALASQLSLLVPRHDSVLEELEVPIRGETRPENKITINDEPVRVHADGRFGALVSLEPGTNTVVIESEDENGNTARFERVVTTSSSSYFLLAMGDVALSGRNADLPGSNEHTRINAGDVAFDGRAVLFGKARFATNGPFKRISLLGHLDTGLLGEPEILRENGDPLRLLPAFGDASLEEQEIPGHRAVHLEVDADHSFVLLGSRATSIASFGDDSFFSYRRAGFGVHGALVKSIGENDETRVQGAYTFGERGVHRGHDELQGTGGAMYWLSHPELVDGSEHVRLVIRDRDTGLVLLSEDKVRDEDYEMRPREGRIALREPLPSVSGTAMTGWNRSLALSGHPVYLVIDYEYESDSKDEKSFGVDLRETLFDQLEFYGGVAGENVPGKDYRLFGAGLAWRPAPGSSIELEWAHSNGTTELGNISTDGGLSFGSLAPQALAGVTLTKDADAFAGALGSDAFSAVGKLSFGDVMHRADLEGKDPGYLRGYAQAAGIDFASLSSSREAGRLRLGVGAKVAVSSSFSLRASVDSALSAVPPELLVGGVFTKVPSMQRTLLVGGADYAKDKNALGFEAAYLATASDRFDATLGAFSARYERALNERMRISIAQEILFGDDPFLPQGAGRAGTTAGVSWAITDALSLSLAETVHWNGDNATQLGAKTRVIDNFSTYIAERLTDDHDGTRLATVIGAEDSFGEGSRSYLEYQIDGANPALSRAVMGMDNRWRIAPGVELLIAYERMQRVSDAVAVGTEPRFRAPLFGLASTLAPYSSTLRGAADSFSRDALSAGVVWTRLERLKLSSRFELRSENGDAQLGGHDYLVFGTHDGLELSVSRDITLLGRLTWQRANDTVLQRKYAEVFEWSLGAALRPRTDDWFTLLVRYTRQLLQRPLDTDPLGLVREEQRDALSIEPIIDTPWNVQLVEKVALISERATQDVEGESSGLDALWINRLNARFLEQFEAGLEYRMLVDLSLDTAERGVLIEAGWIPEEHVRVGAGYNFTSFSDDVLVATSRDAGGPFLRITGRY